MEIVRFDAGGTHHRVVVAMLTDLQAEQNFLGNGEGSEVFFFALGVGFESLRAFHFYGAPSFEYYCEKMDRDKRPTNAATLIIGYQALRIVLGLGLAEIDEAMVLTSGAIPNRDAATPDIVASYVGYVRDHWWAGVYERDLGPNGWVAALAEARERELVAIAGYEGRPLADVYERGPEETAEERAEREASYELLGPASNTDPLAPAQSL